MQPFDVLKAFCRQVLASAKGVFPKIEGARQPPALNHFCSEKAKKLCLSWWTQR